MYKMKKIICVLRKKFELIVVPGNLCAYNSIVNNGVENRCLGPGSQNKVNLIYF